MSLSLRSRQPAHFNRPLIVKQSNHHHRASFQTPHTQNTLCYSPNTPFRQHTNTFHNNSTLISLFMVYFSHFKERLAKGRIQTIKGGSRSSLCTSAAVWFDLTGGDVLSRSLIARPRLQPGSEVWVGSSAGSGNMLIPGSAHLPGSGEVKGACLAASHCQLPQVVVMVLLVKRRLLLINENNCINNKSL